MCPKKPSHCYNTGDVKPLACLQKPCLLRCEPESPACPESRRGIRGLEVKKPRQSGANFLLGNSQQPDILLAHTPKARLLLPGRHDHSQQRQKSVHLKIAAAGGQRGGSCICCHSGWTRAHLSAAHMVFGTDLLGSLAQAVPESGMCLG